MVDSIKNNEKIHVPTVVIVGRPNVGKSSLFNVLLRTRISIVHEASGVTRDRIVAPVIRDGRYFNLVDTGGLGLMKNETKGGSRWDESIQNQVKAAIEGADLLLMVVDVQSGVLPLDRDVALRLHESGKPVFLVATKADNENFFSQVVNKEYVQLGFGPVHAVSSLHRIGLDDLMQKVINKLGDSLIEPPSLERFKIAVVGRPNVGKSSLINRLLGEDRVLVSDEAGTTRDAVKIDFEIQYRDEKRPAVLIDTAGLRKKAKVDEIVEYFSTMRVTSAMKQADLILFVVEADEYGSTAQDRRIAQMIEESGKACIVVVNKWDTCNGLKMKEIYSEFEHSLPHLAYAPKVFTCALSGFHFEELLDQIALVMEQMEVTITTGILNRTVEDIVRETPAPVVDGAPLRIYYGTMVGNRPPSFVLFVNRETACAPNYLAFLERALRTRFGFLGMPIRIHLKNRPKKVESIREGTPGNKGWENDKKNVSSNHKPRPKRDAEKPKRRKFDSAKRSNSSARRRKS